MKILIIGSEKQWAIENFYIRYLKACGAEVNSFPAHDLFDDYYHRSIIRKVLVRSHLSGIYHRINKQLLQQVNQNHFDVIWVFKGMEIYPKTLQQIKKKGIKLVNYNPDHPFIHTSRGSGNMMVKDSVGIYDAHFCYSLKVLDKIEKEYKLPCRWLPFAFEPNSFEFPAKNSEILKACFIGNPDFYRASVIKELINHQIPVDVYGNNWNAFLNETDNLTIYPPVYKKEFSRVAPVYRLHLNIFRPHNDSSHNMRTFEMPGSGCIVLAPDSREHRLLFSQGEEILLYKTMDECIHQAKKLLSITYNEALAIRKAGYERVKKSGYTYEERSRQVYKWMQDLVENSRLDFYNTTN